MAERIGRLEVRWVGLKSQADRLRVKVAVLEKKVEGIAAELTVHHRDTEANRLNVGCGKKRETFDCVLK